MNYCGSYRRLRDNAIAALIAAIEIYNKPAFEYRNECFVILLINAWELLLKAIISSNKRSIYYKKKKGEPYRTLSCRDAMNRARPYFPQRLSFIPIQKNIELLTIYRDNAIHFYNQPGFESLIWALAQTSVINFKDLLQEIFKFDLTDRVAWQLLPIGFKQPVDPIHYLSSKPDDRARPSKDIKGFIAELSDTIKAIEDSGEDTSRLLTIYKIKLESTKKISQADIVMGVGVAESEAESKVVEKKIDPNITHPYRQKEIVEKINQVKGSKFTSYVFQAIIWKFKLKENDRYCWEAKEGVLTKYSAETIAFIRSLKRQEIEGAINDYREHLRKKRAKKIRIG